LHCLQLEFRFPQEFPGELVESAEFLVEIRGADEEESASCDHGTTVVIAAGIFDSFRDQLGILAKRNLPPNVALV